VAHKYETPHKGGASRNQLGGWLRDPLTPLALQSQFLIGAHHIRPELAAMLPTLAFGGHGL
jgi:hypothetical protein